MSKPRKNVKRIDPRYFMDEKMEEPINEMFGLWGKSREAKLFKQEVEYFLKNLKASKGNSVVHSDATEPGPGAGRAIPERFWEDWASLMAKTDQGLIYMYGRGEPSLPLTDDEEWLANYYLKGGREKDTEAWEEEWETKRKARASSREQATSARESQGEAHRIFSAWQNTSDDARAAVKNEKGRLAYEFLQQAKKALKAAVLLGDNYIKKNFNDWRAIEDLKELIDDLDYTATHHSGPKVGLTGGGYDTKSDYEAAGLRYDQVWWDEVAQKYKPN